MSAPYPYASLLASMIETINTAPVDSEMYRNAVSSANKIATDWAGKSATNAVMQDGGIAQTILTWITSLPCSPKVADERRMTLLATMFQHNNVDGLRDFIGQAKALLTSVSDNARTIAQARNAAGMYVLQPGEDETFPAHVRMVGTLLDRSINGPSLSCMAVLLPHISGVLECYIDTLMTKAIAANATNFMATLFVYMAKAFADYAENQEFILTRLKAWINHARDTKQPCEAYIDKFRESLVVSTRKRKIAEVSNDDANDEETEDDGAVAPTATATTTATTAAATKYKTARSFLGATYKVSTSSKKWMSNKEICADIQKWSTSMGKTYQYHATIGRTLREVFPNMKRKEVDGHTYYNLEMQ